MIKDTSQINADRAIDDINEDRFGFAEISKNLASSVVSSTSRDGMVIGIEGKWGSGKSSLINLMKKQINEVDDNNVSTITFSPWLVSNQADYVPLLTKALLAEVEIISKRKGQLFTEQEIKELTNNLRTYGASAVGGLAALAEYLTILYPNASLISKPSRWLQNSIKPNKQTASISDQKISIAQALNKLNHRFVIILDDLDRLEPHEAVEVTRLVRSVADFPNIIYLLCYDKYIFAHAIEQGLQVKNGNSYLQKIVQVSFHIPQPEAFDLRHWLNSETLKIYSSENEDPVSRKIADDLYSVTDYFGDMETPRDVIAILNSIKFHYAPIKDKVYFPDLVWLHIIKIMKPRLYKWCERYLMEWAVISTRDARASESNTLKDELLDILQNDIMQGHNYIYRLRYCIPGLQPTGEDEIEIFQQLGFDIAELENNKRLGSPEHGRYYFAFSSPKVGMSDTELNAITVLGESTPELLRDRLIELSVEKRQINGSWLEYYFDRISRADLTHWTENQLSNMIFTIVDIMDEVLHSSILRQNMGRLPIAHGTVDLVYKLLRILREKDQERYASILLHVLNDAQSIVWLVDDLISMELRRHGIIPNTQYIHDEKTLSAQEANNAHQIILDRLTNDVDRQRLFDGADIISPLFRWREFDGGEYTKPQAWFEEYTDTDEKFLHVLEGMRGWRSSSDSGISFPLSKNNVAPFADWETCKQRLLSISQNTEISDELRDKAYELYSVTDEKF